MRYALSPLSQLEIEISHEDVPIKAHLDFTLISTQPQPTVRILEVKSTAKLPATLSESYAMQIGGHTFCIEASGNGRLRDNGYGRREPLFLSRTGNTRIPE